VQSSRCESSAHFVQICNTKQTDQTETRLNCVNRLTLTANVISTSFGGMHGWSTLATRTNCRDSSAHIQQGPAHTLTQLTKAFGHKLRSGRGEASRCVAGDHLRIRLPSQARLWLACKHCLEPIVMCCIPSHHAHSSSNTVLRPSAGISHVLGVPWIVGARAIGADDGNALEENSNPRVRSTPAHGGSWL
jgi:hypothetical protein